MWLREENMSYIDIWKRTAIAQTSIPANRFVDPLGRLGGISGVVINPCEKGRMTSVITIGEADVEIASGQTIIAGDLVKSNTQGRAIKSTDNTGVFALSVENNLVKVLVR